jgi:hypothetical protein
VTAQPFDLVIDLIVFEKGAGSDGQELDVRLHMPG